MKNFSEPSLDREKSLEASLEELKIGATMAIESFNLKRSPDNKKGETLLIIVEAGVEEAVVEALFEAGKKAAGQDCQMFVIPKTEHAAQDLGATLGEKMKGADAIFLATTLSRSHAKESVEMMNPQFSAEAIESLLNSPSLKGAFSHIRDKSPEDLAGILSKKKFSPEVFLPSKSRFISITNARREIFSQGAASENPKEMAGRSAKFEKIMEDIEWVRITSANGTDLTLRLKKEYMDKEIGVEDG